MDDTYFLAGISGFSYLEYRPEPYEEPFLDVKQYHSFDLPSVAAWDVTVPYGVRQPEMANFVYEDGPGLIKISADGYHIRINEKLISLEMQLSDPSEEVVWLPSAFYYAEK